MELKFLADNYAVAPQITAQDISAIKEQGFERILAVRPDGEEPNQPTHAQLSAAATELGLDYDVIPMSGPQYDQAMLDQFIAVTSSGQKILAFCRTGNRASILWNACTAN